MFSSIEQIKNFFVCVCGGSVNSVDSFDPDEWFMHET